MPTVELDYQSTQIFKKRNEYISDIIKYCKTENSLLLNLLINCEACFVKPPDQVRRVEVVAFGTGSVVVG